MLYVLSTLSYDVSLLPHFLRYYRHLGVDCFIISVQELVPGITEEAKFIATQCGCDVKWIPISRRHELSGLEANNKEEIRASQVKPDDWIIPADLDEFIQFPAPIERLISEMQKNDCTFIKGEFCDRISINGDLSKTLRTPSIWQQYPLVCDISRQLIRCWCHKVTLCRGDCILSSGHHNVITPDRPFITRRSVIHHFKWRAGLLEALQRRVAVYKRERWNNHRESERALRYFEKHGCVKLSDLTVRQGWIPDVPKFESQSVIITSITNSYDLLKEIPFEFKGQASAVAFMDPIQESASWKVLNAPTDSSDSCRNAKRPKILPHLYFPYAEYSLWIDGSVEIISPISLNTLIERYLRSSDIAVFKHRVRKCIFTEAEACIRSKRDNPNTIRRQIAKYKYESYPRSRGLAECCVILRRHTPKIQLLNEVWWDEIVRHSRRDQLSFDFVCWKLRLKYERFNGTIGKNLYFRKTPHQELRQEGAVLHDNTLGYTKQPVLISSGEHSLGSPVRNLSPRGRSRFHSP
jgi:hypothetical protein